MGSVQWNKVGIQEAVPVEVRAFSTGELLWEFDSLKDCAKTLLKNPQKAKHIANHVNLKKNKMKLKHFDNLLVVIRKKSVTN